MCLSSLYQPRLYQPPKADHQIKTVNKQSGCFTLVSLILGIYFNNTNKRNTLSSVVITLKSLTLTNSENPTGADQQSLLILHNEVKGISFHPAAALL